MSNLFSVSKRKNMTYFMISAWLFFGVFGIMKGVDLTGLAAFFAAGAAPVLGYLWGETSRPSVIGKLKEAVSNEKSD
jgi:hypothetical protein